MGERSDMLREGATGAADPALLCNGSFELFLDARDLAAQTPGVAFSVINFDRA